MTRDTQLSFSSNTPKKPAPRRPWAALVVVLLLGGGALWFWMAREPERRETMLHSARETMTAVTEKAEQFVGTVTGKGAEETLTPADSAAQTGTTAAGAGQVPGQEPGQEPGQTSGQEPGQTSGQTGSPTAGHAEGTATTSTVESAESADPTIASSGAANLADPTHPDALGSEAAAVGRTTRGLVSNDPQHAPADAGGRTDDAIVRIGFITDLARWMVERYTPATAHGGRGTLSIGIQSANARYGAGMKGLAWIGDDLPAGRAEALKYVYSSNMLSALYRMYVDRFMEAMAASTAEPHKNGKALEPAQIAEMYRLYAGRFRALSGAMQGVASVSDLRGRMARLHAATQAMVTANTHYMEEVFKFDQAREKQSESAIAAARKAMEKASDAYRQATVDRENLRADLISVIRTNPEARSFGDDNLLFVANWIDRRLQQSPFALEASQQAATMLRDLALRFEQAIGQLP